MTPPRTGPGRVVRVSGPLVEMEGLGNVAMSELVGLGPEGLLAEVVGLDGDRTTVQAYEYTGGLAVGDPARRMGRPLSARLGPHLLGGVFDGLLRPLSDGPVWLVPGAATGGTAQPQLWTPLATEGTRVDGGAVLGTATAPGRSFVCRVLVPPGVSGTIDLVAPAGTVDLDDTVARVGATTVRLSSWWPVRRPRPVGERLTADEPLVTGQRVLDALFPLALGGRAAVPGGFGTGKTMLLQQVAKLCSADVIVYVGCGERGNEMADVLVELGRLTDPRTGRRLAERTVIIANTSNMPMMAREASVYTGVTVAEYFRDMGYHAVLIADSTSRWAEALREFASRSGELPAEEGYPASLSSALAAFYERAGRVRTLTGDTASVTVIGAVSPAGGDTTEPVTAQTQRFVRELWNLDRDLAYARHYPAVSWAGSFSRDADALARWHAANGDPDWGRRRARTAGLLTEADRLTSLVELVGAGSLPAHERITLLAGRLLREGVLQQNALSDNDAHSAAPKTAALIEAVLAVVDRCEQLAGSGTPVEALEAVDYSPLLRAAREVPPDDVDQIARRRAEVLDTLARLS